MQGGGKKRERSGTDLGTPPAESLDDFAVQAEGIRRFRAGVGTDDEWARAVGAHCWWFRGGALIFGRWKGGEGMEVGGADPGGFFFCFCRGR